MAHQAQEIRTGNYYFIWSGLSFGVAFGVALYAQKVLRYNIIQHYHTNTILPVFDLTGFSLCGNKSCRRHSCNN